eukprot:TRINITY_DN2086_c0_g3_i11.p3 TRINITY_DN2086_c0_g3~~TRINITY_DN2086_c0_g3_i11.p3  ORF type:complete len:100 (+),score=25.31 TRINITY_DN2086_c0_g3_i11:565-864(+)
MSFPFLLMGNKLDQESERQVASSKAFSWCRQNGGITFLETSAKDQTNVMEGFVNVAKQAFQKKCKIEPILIGKSIAPRKKLTKKKLEKKDNCPCCFILI